MVKDTLSYSSEEKSVLSVLESLAGSSDLPQRKIAAKTGLNLAKVNFVLKKLIDKGFVKLQHVKENPHKLKYLYILTPTGMSEKSRLAYRFMRRTLKNYREAEAKIRLAVQSMTEKGIKRIALWGHNEITEACKELLDKEKDRIDLLGVVDPKCNAPGCIHPSDLAKMQLDALVVCDTESNGIPPGIPIWRLV